MLCTFSYVTFEKPKTDGLDWLKHSPGGIKLNPQMTSFLTKLCYHHVRIWQSYAKLILARLIEHQAYILALGKISISAFSSFLSISFSVFTLHFYCFYVYALRLYQVWIYGLGEFWNLFRGLKYNPLKCRVDTIYEEFDTLRFILGAMIFSIFLFLFPTVLIFYLVFTLMRTGCLLIKFTLTIPNRLMHRRQTKTGTSSFVMKVISGNNI